MRAVIGYPHSRCAGSLTPWSSSVITGQPLCGTCHLGPGALGVPAVIRVRRGARRWAGQVPAHHMDGCLIPVQLVNGDVIIVTPQFDQCARERTLGPGTDSSFERVSPLLSQIAEDLYAELGRRVSDAMAEAGEDPKLTELFLLRVVQTAWSIRSAAEKAAGR